ncbi:aspartate/glutamate racemase family protein [Actinopolymorpha pittospori]|uniref:Aspartate/glutamate racemase n=1 Tax=Actinopolymorpha pittospori TaxID=648752 RepID=A0A927N3R2_9ACTN|nr:aspartate/glutamate racemase family protein [Actinopolymorpha pittospori]MBE1608397.1 aspartate/glutamate racemase [Actinopolymorpha pittospori]
MTRVALLHTGAVVIPIFADLAATCLPGVEIQHLLDDRIVADLGRGADQDQIAARLTGLGTAAKAAGAAAVVFTCSSISGYADRLAGEVDLPVYRIDEAMADEAVGSGGRVSVVATVETTLKPTAALLHARAALLGRRIELVEVLVPGAFDAVVAGDRPRHDALIAAAIREQAAASEVVVLAQASMASAADQVEVTVPVLTSPELGMRRIAATLTAITDPVGER